jgi:membrane protein YqaA with SNARE-associated domain
MIMDIIKQEYKMIRKDRQNQARIKSRRYSYLKSNQKDNLKQITLKEESLYKPLLVTFLVFLFLMVIIFPNSIFDARFPAAMDFIRTLVSWLSLSAIATLLVFPVSGFDAALIIIFNNSANTDLYIIFVILFAVFADTLFAYIGYRFTKQLSRLFARKVKKKDVENSNQKLRKYGNYGMFLFASTPLPFTLAVYTAGALRLNKKGFLIGVALGRLVKYTTFAIFIRLLGINIFEIGQNLFQLVFGT